MTIKRSDASSSVLSALRRCTKGVHKRLHVHPVMRNMVRRQLTIGEYVTVLHALEHFYISVQAALQSLPGNRTVKGSIALLKQDYAHITGQRHNPLLPCPSLDLAYSEDSSLGVMYVLEGSRQGGSVMAGNIKKTLNLDIYNGAAFFGKDDLTEGTDWIEFTNTLENHCSDVHICSDAAERTFNLMESYLWSVHRQQSENIRCRQLIDAGVVPIASDRRLKAYE